MAKNIDNGGETTELELEAGYNESRVYELGFHIDPELPETEVRKTYQSIREQIASIGTVVAEGEPVNVQLAYTISRQDPAGRRDFNSAFFAWIAYETTGEGHEQIAAMARTEGRIVRFLDVRTSVDAAKHSAEMSEIYARAAAEEAAQQQTESESDVSDVELDAALKEAGV